MPEVQKEQSKIPDKQRPGRVLLYCLATALLSVVCVIRFETTFPELWRSCTGMNSFTEAERREYEYLKMYESDMAVNLPASGEKQSSLSTRSKVLVINVKSGEPDRDAPLYVVESKKMTLPELRKLVAEGLQCDKEMKVLIRSDKMALHGNVARVISACYAEGVSDAKIGYIHAADE